MELTHDRQQWERGEDKRPPSPTFLEQAVGELIGKFPKAEIISKLKVTGLSPADKVILNGIVVNRYHALANAEKRKSRSQLPPH